MVILVPNWSRSFWTLSMLVPRSNPNKTHVNHCNVVMAAALAPSARYIVHGMDIDFSDMSFEVLLSDTRKGSSQWNEGFFTGVYKLLGEMNFYFWNTWASADLRRVLWKIKIFASTIATMSMFWKLLLLPQFDNYRHQIIVHRRLYSD